MVVVGLAQPVALKNGKLATNIVILRCFGENIVTVMRFRKVDDHFVFNIKFILKKIMYRTL